MDRGLWSAPPRDGTVGEGATGVAGSRHPDGEISCPCPILYSDILSLLLDQRFGLNRVSPTKRWPRGTRGWISSAQLGRQARPVDPRVVEPYLGFYEHDYSLLRDGGHCCCWSALGVCVWTRCPTAATWCRKVRSPGHR